MATYDDVVFFYKDKEIVIDYNPQQDACNELAKTFYYGCGKSDDYAYSHEIKKRMIDGTLTQLATFKYFKEEDAFELVLSGFTPIKKLSNKRVINPSQKWHLYVSHLAYQEINAILKFTSNVIEVPGDKFVEKTFCFGKQIKQKEYVRWMKKAAVFDERLLWEDVKNSVENLRKN